MQDSCKVQQNEKPQHHEEYEYELEYKLGNKLLSNDAAITKHVSKAARKTLGDESKVTANIQIKK